MNNTVEMFIYHDTENKMLIVNHERKEYKIVNDYNLINIFRTTTQGSCVNYATLEDIVYFISKLSNREYKDMSTLVKC